MKYLIVIIAIILIVPFSDIVFAQEERQEAEKDVSLIFGFRLQSDQLFYVSVGAKTKGADAGIGLGWNNTVWLGFHKYFHQNESLAVLTGLEIHVVYPAGGTIEFHPALPLGFVITQGQTILFVESLIQPAGTGQQITSTFAVQFMMEL